MNEEKIFILDELPNGWELKPIEKLFKIRSGEFLSAKMMVESGLYNVYGGNGVNGKFDDFNVEGENIVIGRVGAKCGNVRLVNEQIWLTDNAFYISEYLQKIDKKYLSIFLSYIDLGSTANQAAQPVISYRGIKDLKIPLPSLDEQQRIVETLDAVFDRINKIIQLIQENLEHIDHLLPACLNDVFKHAKENGWAILSLEELLKRNIITSHLDGNHGSFYPKSEEFVSEGVPYISANSIENGKVNFLKAKFLSAERAAQLRKGVAMNGDVLFAHNATVGPVALLETSAPKVILSTSLTYYRCNSNNLENSYLYFYLQSEKFISQYKEVMGQATRNQVPITKQREFFHIIPPLDEQIKIAKKLIALEKSQQELQRQYTRKLQQLKSLKASLLYAAFRGELTKNSRK